MSLSSNHSSAHETMSTPPSGTATPGGGTFGTLGVGSLVGAVVVVIVGAVGVLWAFTRPVYASCAGRRMGPEDRCEVLKNGVAIGSKTYAEMLVEAQERNNWIIISGCTLAAIGVIFLVVLLLRWQRDRALLGQLTTSEPVLASQGQRSRGSFLTVVVGAILTGLVVVGVSVTRREDQPVFYVVCALFGYLAIHCLFAGLPRGGSMTQVCADRLRLARGGKLIEAAWHQVGYLIIPDKGTPGYAVEVAGRSYPLNSGAEAEELRELIRKNSVEAKLPGVLRTLQGGEPTQFGQVTLTSTDIVLPLKVTIPLTARPTVLLKNGMVVIDTDQTARGGQVRLNDVSDYGLFAHAVNVLHRQVASGQ